MAYKNNILDETDLRLLKILWNSGRATLAEMGKDCGLSAPGVADRLRRLERNGVILGYAPRIGLAAAGMFSVMAWGSVVAMGVAVIR